jgi:argininosuccinate lyase
MDSVADRDFVVEHLAALSLLAVHLSRLAEELILWASQPFGFVALPDAWSTGSSIMPQKRNPDAAELTRGHAGRILGALTALCVTMKGLPLAYNKDMQEDKEAVFDAFDTVKSSLVVTSTVLRNIGVRKVTATGGYMNATELADYLVKKGMPFRDAHETVGRVVIRAIELKIQIEEMALEELKTFSSLIDADVYEALSLERTLNAKTQIGGTARGLVHEALAEASRRLAGSSPGK